MDSRHLDLKPIEFVSRLKHADEGRGDLLRPLWGHDASARLTNTIELTFLDPPTREEWPHLLRPTLAPVFREHERVRCRVPMNGSLLSFTLLVERIEPNVRLIGPYWTAGGELVGPIEISRGPYVVTGQAVEMEHGFLAADGRAVASYEPVTVAPLAPAPRHPAG